MEAEHPHTTANVISLALHRRVAAAVRDDPSRVDDALVAVDRDEARGTLDPRYAARWRAVLRGPRAGLFAVLECDDEPARELRQNSPFAGVVPDRERQRIVRDAWAAARERERLRLHAEEPASP